MNLRSMVDGGGNLQLNVQGIEPDNNWKPQDDVVVRRRTARSGPNTSEILIGKILAVGEDTATVSIRKPGGITERREVQLDQLSPVTDSFRRRSIQFNPQYRPRA